MITRLMTNFLMATLAIAPLMGVLFMMTGEQPVIVDHFVVGR